MKKRQKNVYLTVDLDYWWTAGMHKNLDYIKQLLGLNRPVTVYTEHQLILREITKQYKKVYNVDYHSDISQREPGWPNCGDWVNFTQGRENSEYEWRLPDWKECVTNGGGLCHKGHKENGKMNPFKDDSLHGWKNVGRKQGLRNIPLDDVDKISLILSPEWSCGVYITDTLNHLLELEKEGQVKFFGRNVRPLINKMIDRTEPLYDWY
jgi:hypothetical protein